MRSLLKYGISVLALTVGLGAANAQNMDEKRPQGQDVQRQDNGGEQQHQQGERQKRGSEAMQEKSQGDRKERMGKSEESKPGKEKMGQADERKGGKEKMSQADERKDEKADERKDSKGKMGQADERKDGKDKMGQSDERKDSKDNASKQAGDMDKDRKDGGKRADNDRGGKRSHSEVKKVKITTEKKTVIRDKIVMHAPHRYKRNEVHFSLSIGTAIPDTYTVYDVSPSFVSIVPEFEGYDYIVVGDVLLIIDPDTREIVDVVDV
jgi:Protein of unknown function (DUF1236)